VLEFAAGGTESCLEKVCFKVTPERVKCFRWMHCGHELLILPLNRWYKWSKKELGLNDWWISWFAIETKSEVWNNLLRTSYWITGQSQNPKPDCYHCCISMYAFVWSDHHYGRAVILFGIPYVYTQSRILKVSQQFILLFITDLVSLFKLKLSVSKQCLLFCLLINVEHFTVAFLVYL